MNSNKLEVSIDGKIYWISYEDWKYREDFLNGEIPIGKGIEEEVNKSGVYKDLTLEDLEIWWKKINQE